MRLRRDTPSALRGNVGLAYNGNGASIFYSCLSHSVFPALGGNEIENQSFREFMFRKDTPTRATGRETGVSSQAAGVFAGTQARI